MISELTKVLDRNYFIGYLVPAVLFLTISMIFFQLFFPADISDLEYQLSTEKNTSLQNDIINTRGGNIGVWLRLLQNFWTFSFVLVITIIFSFLLMVCNRFLIRLLEGYIILDRNFMKNRHENKYYSLLGTLGGLEYLKQRFPDKVHILEFNATLRKLRQYPSSEYIMPTEFGNVIRAFEYYSTRLYNLDAIPIWPRIMHVVPNELKDSLNSSKSQVDFAVNILYLSLFALLEYFMFVLWTKSLPMFWMLLPIAFIAYLGYKAAVSSANQWGLQVKVIFDLYRYDLLRKMGITIPDRWEDERDLWEQLNRSFEYQYEFNDDSIRDIKNDN